MKAPSIADEQQQTALRRTPGKRKVPGRPVHQRRICGACQQARALLNGRGVPFSEKRLTSQEELTALGRQLGGRRRAAKHQRRPAECHRLCSPQTWNELLDFAGYPATAPYGFKPATPPAE
jgi:hypothetical protein